MPAAVVVPATVVPVPVTVVPVAVTVVPGTVVLSEADFGDNLGLAFLTFFCGTVVVSTFPVAGARTLRSFLGGLTAGGADDGTEGVTVGCPDARMADDDGVVPLTGCLAPPPIMRATSLSSTSFLVNDGSSVPVCFLVKWAAETTLGRPTFGSWVTLVRVTGFDLSDSAAFVGSSMTPTTTVVSCICCLRNCLWRFNSKSYIDTMDSSISTDYWLARRYFSFRSPTKKLKKM